MALSANTVWRVRTDGNDGQGGGFVTGATGVDRSQQAAAHATLTTSSVVNATTTLIDVAAGDHTVSADDVGNILQITGGTATAGFYHITAVDVGNNRWTVDRSAGTAGQTVAGKMGGALASPGMLGAAVNAGPANTHAYIREGTYTLTSASPNVSGGTYSNTSNISCCIIGHAAAGGPTDLSAGPTIDVGALDTIAVFDINNAANSGVAIVNITVDGQGAAGIIAFDIGGSTGVAALLCNAIDCVTGFTGGASRRVLGCKASGCTTGFTGFNVYWRCWADACTTGFLWTSNGTDNFIDCAASDCGAPFSTSSNQAALFLNCTSDGATGNDGIAASTLGCAVIASVLTDASLYGIDLNALMTFSLGNATYNNTSGALNAAANGQTISLGAVALTADPYENAAADDYRPNNTAGGGAELRGAGIPVRGQTDSRDIGAVQHTDPAGGGGMLVHPGMSGGLRG